MPDHPNPPWRVLAIAEGHHYPHWHYWDADAEVFINDYNPCCDIEPHEITTIDHPRNDPEAVEIIKKAKGEV